MRKSYGDAGTEPDAAARSTVEGGPVRVARAPGVAGGGAAHAGAKVRASSAARKGERPGSTIDGDGAPPGAGAATMVFEKEVAV